MKSGDTLSKIGDKYGVRWQEIASKNSLNAPYTIYPGQELLIGEKKGDSNRENKNDSTNNNPVVSSNGSLIDKLLGVFILYGIFQVLKKVL